MVIKIERDNCLRGFWISNDNPVGATEDEEFHIEPLNHVLISDRAIRALVACIGQDSNWRGLLRRNP